MLLSSESVVPFPFFNYIYCSYFWELQAFKRIFIIFDLIDKLWTNLITAMYKTNYCNHNRINIAVLWRYFYHFFEWYKAMFLWLLAKLILLTTLNVVSNTCNLMYFSVIENIIQTHFIRIFLRGCMVSTIYFGTLVYRDCTFDLWYTSNGNFKPLCAFIVKWGIMINEKADHFNSDLLRKKAF